MKLSTDPNKYNTFIFYSGFAESGSTGSLIVNMVDTNSVPKAKTWQEAWELSFERLREAYFSVLKMANGYSESSDSTSVSEECCFRPICEGHIFCPYCGYKLKDKRETRFPSEEEHRAEISLSLLTELISSDNDSYRYDRVELACELGWNIPGTIIPGLATVVTAQAEKLLINYEKMKTSYYWEDSEGFWDKEFLKIYSVK